MSDKNGTLADQRTTWLSCNVTPHFLVENSPQPTEQGSACLGNATNPDAFVPKGLS